MSLVRLLVRTHIHSLVRDFQSIIGREARQQILEQAGRFLMPWLLVLVEVQMQWACSSIPE